MIDFEKLKLVHKLTQDLVKMEHCYHVDIRMVAVYYSTLEPDYYFDVDINTKSPFPSVDATLSIDELINKLRELSMPQPKFGIGERVWIIDGAKPITAVIENYYPDKKDYLVHYDEHRTCIMPEKHIHRTRERLIDGEIKYWTELRDKNE